MKIYIYKRLITWLSGFFTTLFQSLTSWRLSEAVSVSMVWMLSKYYYSNSKPVHFIMKIIASCLCLMSMILLMPVRVLAIRRLSGHSRWLTYLLDIDYMTCTGGSSHLCGVISTDFLVLPRWYISGCLVAHPRSYSLSVIARCLSISHQKSTFTKG